ncbi:competence protein CoiA family protein [Arthrobacter sp.]|uniref:competence protein CoiA family protein n=1 Tax=Arthrobacter sp. TaxID=1667 RepID=UPI0028111098|nr:competence protein CoiA family protein [Arthrobacter sp.]
MIEIRPLYPRTWEPSEPLVAYNNADSTVVAAAEMTRGNNSYYDRYGYQGSQDIVCADCKQDGRDVPVILVDAKGKRLHFRHKQGEAPDGLGRHGETAEHLRGKQLIMDWARNQHHILPWSVEEEFWVTGTRLRSDVKAELADGRHLAFEIQRKPLDWKDWDRRHGGYQNGGVHDVWLWSPDVPDPLLDLPLTSVVLDMEHDSLGIFIANHGGGYRHPTAEKHLRPPTHYAAAPLTEWSISATGALVPPLGMTEYLGDKPEHARRHQLAMHWEAVAREPRPSAAPPLQPRVVLPEKHAPSGGYETRVDPVEQQRISEAIARIFNKER